MLYVEIRENCQTGTYSARVFDGPDGIDDALLTANSLGELFEKIVQFRSLNAMAYGESLQEAFGKYFGSLEPAYKGSSTYT